MTNGDVNRKPECKCSLLNEMTKWVNGSQGKTNKTKIQECSFWVQANLTIDMVVSIKMKILSYQLAF
jgi:hypothetical protein